MLFRLNVTRWAALLACICLCQIHLEAALLDVEGQDPNGLGSGKFNIFTGATLSLSWTVDSISGSDTFQLTKWETGMSRFAAASNPLIVSINGPSGATTVRTIGTGEVTANGASASLFNFTFDSPYSLTVGTYTMTFQTTAAASNQGWVVSELSNIEFVDAADGTTSVAAITSTLDGQAVPEPQTYATLVAMGLVGLTLFRKWNTKKTASAFPV